MNYFSEFMNQCAHHTNSEKIFSKMKKKNFVFVFLNPH